MKMKKFLSGGKIWTILSALIFFATFGLVVYAANSTGGLFDKYKTGANGIGNKLKANDWNNLMSDLNKLEIPDGAVMAFEGPCPTELGWYDYKAAKGRFIIGDDNNSFPLGDFGGKSAIQLSAPNLPPHSHKIHLLWRGTEAGDGVNQAISVGHSKPGGMVSKGETYGYTEDNYNGSMQGTEFSIMNPYIALHYCIKGQPKYTERYKCTGEPGANTKQGNNITENSYNTRWKYVDNQNPGPCEYTCLPGMIRENNKCKINNYQWCCKNGTLGCYEGEIRVSSLNYGNPCTTYLGRTPPSSNCKQIDMPIEGQEIGEIADGLRCLFNDIDRR